MGSTIGCDMGAYIPVSQFINTINKYADTAGIDRKIAGRRLELTVENIPHVHRYVENGVVFLLISGGMEKVIPRTDALVVSCKLWDNGKMLKNGKITIDDDATTTYNVRNKPPRPFIESYLNKYSNHIDRMSRLFLMQLSQQLSS